MKKLASVLLGLSLLCTAFAMSEEINVITREEGSGTRSAFAELFGIETDGVDAITDDADVTNSTAVMMIGVSGNPNAIGYASLGTCNDSVRVLAIDGIEANAENIISGDYKICRPFNIATRGTLCEPARAFRDFLLSAEGQSVVEENGYIAAVGNAAPFAGSDVEGKVVVAGSSSVAPVMEKLSEAYRERNPNAEIEVQQSDSTAGMTATVDGVCDIGMASRELRESERAAGLTSTVIATDGIAVIVSPENPLTALTGEQVRAIYLGEITGWEELAGSCAFRCAAQLPQIRNASLPASGLTRPVVALTRMTARGYPSASLRFGTSPEGEAGGRGGRP